MTNYQDVALDVSQVDEIVAKVTEVLVNLEDKTGEWKYTCAYPSAVEFEY